MKYDEALEAVFEQTWAARQQILAFALYKMDGVIAELEKLKSQCSEGQAVITVNKSIIIAKDRRADYENEVFELGLKRDMFYL